MPYDEPDPEDPMALVGVALPAGREAQVEMAAAFADEFARLGFDAERVLGLFRRPFYAGAHQLWRSLGESAIEAIVRDSAATWGRVRLVDRDAPFSGRGHEGEDPDA